MSTHPAKGESINRRFRYIATALYVVVVAIMLWLFAIQWRGYWDAYEARNEFRALSAALQAMADVSSERRPTFGAIVTENPTPDAWLKAMKAARAATDARMDELGKALENPDCKSCAELFPHWRHAKDRLAEARENLDALRLRARADRPAASILASFDRLSTVIPQLSGIAETSASGVIRENADVQSYLLVARISALLREHAGLMASQYAPALIAKRALNEREIFDIARTRGKIEQLQVLLIPSIRVLPPKLQQDYDAVDKRFFGDALTLLDKLREDTRLPGGAGVAPFDVSLQYGPLLEPINRFRDDALDLSGRTIATNLTQHLLLLIGTGIFASALTGLLLIMMWRFREKIVRPFAEARRFILAVASGDLNATLPEKAYGSEVQELFVALNVLKENDAKRLKLEKERKRLIDELRVMADTDALTGLLNRRSFDVRANVMFEDKRDANHVIAVLMLDIDHFKRVNDTYGHESGDRALVTLATLCRETVRLQDVVARFGGEEFVIMLRVREAPQARAIAEQLRQRLHEESVTAVDGRVFDFTVSIGIAYGWHSATRTPNVEALLREADARLYAAKSNGRDRIEEAAAAQPDDSSSASG